MPKRAWSSLALKIAVIFPFDIFLFLSYIISMKRVEVANKAKRQIDKISDRKIITDIYEAMEQLENWPDVRGVKSLVNRNDYRLRVGRYRVLFFVENEAIVITEVKIRNEKT